MKYAAFVLLAGLLLCQQADPWTQSDLLEPEVFAKTLQSGKTPVIICVAFPSNYSSRHITKAVYAGPTSKSEGIESLKKAVGGVAKDADVVLYCGCCPMDKCPNIRPAFRTLKEMGFTHLRVLSVPTNMHTDWFSKGYPTDEVAAK
jgi:thiosulfate/3-mercaptopyruvate sulfurtransferase